MFKFILLEQIAKDIELFETTDLVSIGKNKGLYGEGRVVPFLKLTYKGKKVGSIIDELVGIARNKIKRNQGVMEVVPTFYGYVPSKDMFVVGFDYQLEPERKAVEEKIPNTFFFKVEPKNNKFELVRSTMVGADGSDVYFAPSGMNALLSLYKDTVVLA